MPAFLLVRTGFSVWARLEIDKTKTATDNVFPSSLPGLAPSTGTYNING